jgi:predicted RNA-binding Zn-ribbon protein involved in translation (DUF1610 family)
MVRDSANNAGASKRVACTHCNEFCDVGRRAMSVFCPHCRKRLILESFKIRSYKGVRELATCGDVVVERRGHVVATVIADNLIVKGKVQGKVTARGRVAVSKTGNLRGDVEAPSISVEGGAVLQGFWRIGAPTGNATTTNPA